MAAAAPASFVNADDAILTSKVHVQDRECVLVLSSQRLSCREFASNQEAFALSLNHILGVRVDKANAKVVVVTGVFRDPRGSAQLFQMDMKVACVDADEAGEWVETLSSIITDNNIRVMQADTQRTEQRQAQEAANVNELKQMFPNVDEDVLLSILVANGHNTAACIEPLLAMSDPNYSGTLGVAETGGSGGDGAVMTLQEQMLQDELLAKMLQDELFMGELRRDGRYGGAAGGATSGTASGAATQTATGPSFTDRVQSMSQATKKGIVDLYHKFTSSRPTKRGNDNSEPMGQEMLSLNVRPTEEEYNNFPEEEDDDDESSTLLRAKQPARDAPRGSTQNNSSALPWDADTSSPHAPAVIHPTTEDDML